MEKFGHIPLIEKGVVFSDPWYKEDVWCQYRKEFIDSNWLMKMETKHDPELGYIDFTLVLGRPTMMKNTRVKDAPDGSLSISYLTHYDMAEKEIGMDTAQIFCGSMKNWDQFGESAALHTGTDGFFGSLLVFTVKGDDEPAGFVLLGGIDETFANEESLFRHMLSGFDGQEISRKVYQEKTDMRTLTNKVLLSNELRLAAQGQAREPEPGSPER